MPMEFLRMPMERTKRSDQHKGAVRPVDAVRPGADADGTGDIDHAELEAFERVAAKLILDTCAAVPHAQ